MAIPWLGILNSVGHAGLTARSDGVFVEILGELLATQDRARRR
jgi:hypothetical protein